MTERFLFETNQGRVIALLALVLVLPGLGRAWSAKIRPAVPYVREPAWVEYVGPKRKTRASMFYVPPFPSWLEKYLPAALAAGGADGAGAVPERGVRLIVSPGPAGGISNAGLKPLSGAAAMAIGRKLDLNLASIRDLTLLPGIGPVTAVRMASVREKQGRFRSVDDLLRVKGVGPATVDRLRPLADVFDGTGID